MKLIVGLGNPGNEYLNTRHNTGFLTIDKVANILNVSIDHKAFDGLSCKTNYQGQQVILMKPLTYMNNSGQAIRKICNYYHINSQEDLLVLYDDLDLPVGQIRIRAKGSSGGHNGIKSIIENLQTQDFKRIRIGIGKDSNIPVIDYVLGKVRKEDLDLYNAALDKAAKAAIEFINKDFERVMNQYNKAD